MGEDFDASFLHDVFADGWFDFELYHGFFGAAPEGFFLGGVFSEVEVGDEFLELLEHDGVEVLVVAMDDFALVGAVVFFGHVVFV